MARFVGEIKIKFLLFCNCEYLGQFMCISTNLSTS
jgi:hypothetical protein